MLGAAPQLQAGGFVVNADVSRQGKQMVDVLAGKKTYIGANGKEHRVRFVGAFPVVLKAEATRRRRMIEAPFR